MKIEKCESCGVTLETGYIVNNFTKKYFCNRCGLKEMEKEK